VTRFLASFPGYMYAQQGDTLYVNLFAAGTATVTMDGGRRVTVVQETKYPWDGAVTLTVTPASSGTFTMAVRVPGWARDEAVPTDLYRFADRVAAPVRLAVNGAPVPVALEKGYVRLSRVWAAGDVVTLDLPMPVRRVIASDAVAADRGRVAIQRGPIVYAAEGKDNPDGRVRNLVLDPSAPLAAEMRPSLLGGVTVVTGRATALVTADDGTVARKEQPFTAIPYYAWANRGPGEMTVWLPSSAAVARVLPRPTLASSSAVAASFGRGMPSVNDQETPASSADESVPPFHFWPHKGTTEWVEYTLPRPATVSEASVYWFEDAPTGGVRLPVSWRVLYRDKGGWTPVTAIGPYAVAKDALNTVRFAPVTTDALRLEIALQPEWSAGVHEWTVR
jgi:hypothetical protein